MSFIIVDYSKGNVRSVQKGLERAGAHAIISARVEDISTASALVLPGVGSFADASRTMLENGQMQAVREHIHKGVPFLGICLGMQLLFEKGDEGMPEDTWAEGLGFLKGHCRRIDNVDNTGRSFKVPHVGWNQLRYTTDSTDNQELLSGIEDGSHFYFTHSYQCEPQHACDIVATTTHAGVIPSVVCKDNVYGVQFHPEKSSHKGLLLMKNFVQLAKAHAGQESA